MVEKNSIGKSFGPIGSIAGIILLVAGIAVAFYSLSGFILIPFGAFIGFSYSSTTIDFGNPSDHSNPSDGYVKRVKNALNLFGIIPIGKWITIESDMKIGVRKSNLIWRTYSKSNRSIDIKDENYLIEIVDSKKKPVLILKKSATKQTALVDAERLSAGLGIGIYP